MEFVICYLFIYTVEALIFSIYSSNVLTSKYSSNKIKISTISLGYFIIYLLSFFKSMTVNFLSFLIINAILIFILYEVSLFSSFFHSFLLTVIMAISEIICDIALTNMSHDFFTYNALDILKVSLFATISKILYFIIVIIISLLINKNKEHISCATMGDVFLFIIPVLSSFIVMTFFLINYYMDFPKYIDIFISISSFLVLIINICVFSFYKYSKTHQQSFFELQLQLQNESDIAKYNKMLVNQDENQRILIHDIKNHLSSIAFFNKNNDSQKIDSYISKLLNSPTLKDNVNISDNNLLNAIIYRYINKAKDLGIYFHTDIRSQCIDFMPEESITSLFCNLLDNSVEAASKVSNSFIKLTISHKENTPFIVIVVVNSCLTSPFSNKTGKLITKKSNPAMHGFGVKSIKKIVDSHSGEMIMYYEENDNTFHTIISLPQK